MRDQGDPWNIKAERQGLPSLKTIVGLSVPHLFSVSVRKSVLFGRHVLGVVEIQISLGCSSIYFRMKSKPSGVSGPS